MHKLVLQFQNIIVDCIFEDGLIFDKNFNKIYKFEKFFKKNQKKKVYTYKYLTIILLCLRKIACCKKEMLHSKVIIVKIMM